MKEKFNCGSCSYWNEAMQRCTAKGDDRCARLKNFAEIYQQIFDERPDLLVALDDASKTPMLNPDIEETVDKLVEAYGEENAISKLKALLPRPEPLYCCRVGKGENSRWLSGITAHEVTVKLSLAELEFIDLMICDSGATLADGAAFLIRSEFYRFLIGAKLETCGFTDYERVLDITAFAPVPYSWLDPAMEYIDKLAAAKEASSDA